MPDIILWKLRGGYISDVLHISAFVLTRDGGKDHHPVKNWPPLKGLPYEIKLPKKEGLETVRGIWDVSRLES